MPEDSKSLFFWNPRRVGALFIVTLLSITLLLFLLVEVKATATRIDKDFLCVKPGGGDGCQDAIGEALAIAQKGDTIRVASGQYTENILISQTVTLEGGWNADFSIRDIHNFTSTIFPADNTQSVVAIQGDFANSQEVAPTLDGFAITGGRADLGSNHGGGLRIVDSDALVISNTIYNNVAFLLGGGIWVQRGQPQIQGNRIMDNQSVGLGQEAYGGGVQLENSRAALLSNHIAQNVVSGTQSYGGGLSITGLSETAVTLQGNSFFSNTAGLLSNAGFGGAIAVVNAQAELQDNQAIGNNASESGGALYLSATIDNCCQVTSYLDRIQANEATQGGGVYNEGHFFALRDGLLFSNTARTNGGGFLISAGSSISISNSAAVANIAGGDGGAIYNSGSISITNTTISDNRAEGLGGGLANMDSAFILNATVSDNQSPSGAGIMNGSLVMVQNTIIAENNGDNCLGGLFSLDHNLEDGGTCALNQANDQNNIAPMINDLGNYGGNTATHALMTGSPAIDAGNNDNCPIADQRGLPRPADGDGDGVAICDIGAFELSSLISEIYLPVALR